MNNNSYKNLRFTNDFMFCKILTNNPDLCKELIETILDVKIKDILTLEQLEPIEITPDGRGIRLDVRVENEESIYCVEMQNTKQDNIPKRSRYYQALTDMDSLHRNEDYEDLKKSYVIFICNFDLFKRGFRRYVFRTLCVDDPSIEMGDEVEKVFLNAKGTEGKASEKLQEFLNYVATGKPEGELSERLEDEVKMAQNNPMWEAEYAAYYLKLRDERKAGREEGLKEGILQGRQQLFLQLLDQGKTAEEIAALFNMPVEKVTEIIQYQPTEE